MQSRSQFRRRGSALIIVLSFVVLTAIVMLSYLASTQSSLKKSSSSAAMVKTDLLAKAAIGSILDDIRQEMLAGADGTAAPPTNQPMTVTNNWAMVPGRVLSSGVSATDTNFINLVKQSLRAVPFYPGNNPPSTYTAKGSLARATGSTRASAVNTSQSSLNGRMISANRWNKPMLLGGSGFTSTDQLPDWILISRSGPVTSGASLGDYTNKAPSNSQYIIGRYAYNVYDIGGLLDVNIAGFNSSDASAVKMAEKKGSPAWADLSAIPGMLDQAALVRDWRNKLSSATGETYLDMIQTWGQPRGFHEPFERSGQVENRFFTRQDLIRYQQTYGSNVLAADALPYFTTFSADLDRPSYAPFFDVGLNNNRPFVQQAITSGGNDAKGLDRDYNPNLLKLLDSNGKPLVKRRFPLGRLRYVVPEPNAEDEQEIWDYFGLVWSKDSDDYAWIYTDVPNSSVQATRIKTLQEITDREPNFVELLKAAISAGSLGGQFENNNPPEPTTSPRIFGRAMGVVDYHIMKIAANIIDQFDKDSFPTRIKFGAMEFYGIEDLPYLYVIRNMVYRKALVAAGELTIPVPVEDAPTATWDGRTLPYRCIMMLQPTLWNPHAPNTDSPPTVGPTSFRVSADSNGGSVSVMAIGSWWTGPAWSKWAADPLVNPQPKITATYDSTPVNHYPSSNVEDLSAADPIKFDAETDFLSFDTEPTGKASFREPYTLTSPNYPPGSNTKGYVTDSILPDEEPNEEPGGVRTPSLEALGFRVGILWGGPGMRYSSSPTNYNFLMQNKITSSDGITFELKFKAPNNRFYTYDRMDAMGMSQYSGWHDDRYRNPSSTTLGRALPILRYSLRVDPRTQRFGFRDANSYAPKTFRPEGPTTSDNAFRIWLQGMTAWTQQPGVGVGALFGKSGIGMENGHKNATWTMAVSDDTYYYWNVMAINATSSPIHYPDPDGIQRVAMGAEYDGTAVGIPPITGNNASRPMILNRPFRSVAELGYVSRDQPWKQLDFWTPQSADAALLDFFCVSEPLEDDKDSPLTAGHVNLNSRQVPVLQALLQGTAKTDGVKLTDIQARNIAEALVNWTTNSATAKGPLRNRSELIGRYTGDNYSGFSSEVSALLSGTEGKIQIQRQSVIRALADVGTTRTWTFLIDLIVQEGKYPTSDLTKFSVGGEQRYWIQVAIDRFTGQIVAKFVEAVNE